VGPAAAALIDQARAALEPVSRLAVRAQGEDIEACRPHLERVARLLETAVAAMGTDGGRDRPGGAVLEQFRRELKKASVLHQQAGAFYGGMLRIFAKGLEAGYSPRGADDWQFQPGRRVSFEA
jgi:hypothetical protein